MKKQESVVLPDSFFGMFGIYTPGRAEEESAAAYEKGSSITGFLQTERVSTLKKENRYQKSLPKFETMELLKLNLRNIPDNKYGRMKYLCDAIKRKIMKTFSAARKNRDEAPVVELLKNITEIYGDEILIEKATRNENGETDLAADVFGEDSFYRISINGAVCHRAYGTVFGKHFHREHYFYHRFAPSQKIHVICLADFLTELALMSGLSRIRHDIDLPLIQDYFKEYAEKEARQPQLAIDRRMAVDAVKEEKPFPLLSLMQPFDTRHPEYISLNMSTGLKRALSDLYFRIYSLYQDISIEVRERREHAKSIATAYITKKNIPLSVQKAMQETSFLKHFSYVEFDEDVDLAGIKTIEREFQVLNEAYFHNRRYPTVKLRIRKLGKHKATGLYYPGIDTLCVDIRSPSSFVHEFFHMLDDQLGDLSLTAQFEPLAEEYKRAFDEGLKNQSEGVQSRMKGSTKYNKAYYFRRAEIFARCGEIYFTRILKVESSLAKPDLTFAYPESEKLDALIKNYYEELLEKRLEESILPATS